MMAAPAHDGSAPPLARLSPAHCTLGAADTLTRFWGYKYEPRPQSEGAIGIGAYARPAGASVC